MFSFFKRKKPITNTVSNVPVRKSVCSNYTESNVSTYRSNSDSDDTLNTIVTAQIISSAMDSSSSYSSSDYSSSSSSDYSGGGGDFGGGGSSSDY